VNAPDAGKTVSHWFPRAGGATRPSQAWYWGWALYVNRRGFLGAFVRLVPLGALVLTATALVAPRWFVPLAAFTVASAFLVLLHSVLGHALVYGAPAARYFDRLLALGGVRSPGSVADLHIGTWRHSYALHDRLPTATIVSIDIWGAGVEATEGAVRELRELEIPAAPAPRLEPRLAHDGRLPLDDASVDVVVLGLGSHEVEGEAQERLFGEARRVLKPGGTVLFFEHAKNWQSFLIFGPGISHWTEREEWTRRLSQHFHHVRSVRTLLAVDLFAADG
jgi:SAM-dependent methyltransferase